MKWLLIPLLLCCLFFSNRWVLAQQPQHTDTILAPLESDGALSVVSPIPQTGDQPLLVILVDFSDRPGLFTGQAWRQTFFGSGGFADYFKENSYNQLRYTGAIAGIANGAPVTNSSGVAYIRLPYPITYYANGNHGFSLPQYFPRNTGGVVYHALQALDAAGFNFAPYTNSTTKRVENLVVIFAGSSYGYTRDSNNSLEATAYQITHAGGQQFVARGGQVADNYTFCPDQRFNLSQQIAYTGVCAHEHAHGLGMVDLYDFSAKTSGVGYFDLMAYGTFGWQEGLQPFHLGAFSKQRFGWTQPTVIPVGTTTITLAPAESSAAMLKLYPHGDRQSKEYFLLENRQPLGFDQQWTSRNLCAGLVIWHIDQTILDSYFYKNLVNTLPGTSGAPPHQGVVVVEADGRFDMISPAAFRAGECSDTWGVGQSWHATSAATSNLWNGAPSGLTVRVDSENNGVLTLTITVNNGTLPTPTPGPTPTPTATPTPNGNAPFDPNGWYRLSTLWQGAGMSLDVTTANGLTKPLLAPNSTSAHQLWKITPLGNGYYRLTNQGQGEQRSLDILNDDVDRQPILAPSGNYSGQQWKIAALGNGYYRLTTLWLGDSLSLDILNDGANNKPYLATTTNASGQFWQITAVTAGPTPTPNATATATPTAGYGGIRGRVTAESGAALTNITVTVYRFQSNSWRSIATVKSGADGSYQVNNLAAGVYRLRFYDSRRRYKTEYYNNVSTIDRAANITVNSGNLTTGIDAALAPVILVNAERLSLGSNNQVVDAQTGAPIAGASVTLYYVPGWRPRTAADDQAADTCESLLAKAANAPWSQLAPTDLGEWVSPPLADETPELTFAPMVNPQLTTNAGDFAWQVAAGCWYVLAEAEGYQAAVSPVIGVDGALTELTLRLPPIARVFLPLVNNQ